MRRASCTQFSRNGLDYRNPVPGGPVTSHPAYPVRWSARTHDQQVVPSPRMFQGGRNYLSRARLGYTFFLFPLLHERVCSMNAAKFKIGEFVVYRIMRVNQGRFFVMAVTRQSTRDKIRYRIRSQDDGNIERVVDESQLSTS